MTTTDNGAGAGAAGAGSADRIVHGADGNFSVDAAFNEWAASKGIKDFETKAKADPDFYKVATSYRHLEKQFGNDKIILPKEETDQTGWDSVYNRLGRPAKAEEYKFKDDADQTLTNWAKPIFHKLGLTQTQAAGLNEAFDKLLAEGETLTKQQIAEKATGEKAQLSKDWGANFTANQEKASRAWNAMASATGIPQASIDKLQEALGLRDSMRMLEYFSRGLKVTGDSFEGEGTGQRATGLAFTPEQALAEKNKLLNDAEFAKQYRSGKREAREKIAALNAILAAAA